MGITYWHASRSRSFVVRQYTKSIFRSASDSKSRKINSQSRFVINPPIQQKHVLRFKKRNEISHSVTKKLGASVGRRLKWRTGVAAALRPRLFWSSTDWRHLAKQRMSLLMSSALQTDCPSLLPTSLPLPTTAPGGKSGLVSQPVPGGASGVRV